MLSPAAAERPLSFNESTHIAVEWLAHLRQRALPPRPLALALDLYGPVDVGCRPP